MVHVELPDPWEFLPERGLEIGVLVDAARGAGQVAAVALVVLKLHLLRDTQITLWRAADGYRHERSIVRKHRPSRCLVLLWT